MEKISSLVSEKSAPATRSPLELEAFIRGTLASKYIVCGLDPQILDTNPNTKILVNRMPQREYVCERCGGPSPALVARNWDWLFKSEGNYICIVPTNCNACRAAMYEEYKQEVKNSELQARFSTKCGGYQNIVCMDWYSNTPFVFEDLIPTNEQAQLFQYVKQLLSGEVKYGIYLTGTTGVGKTYICSMLNNALIKQGKGVCFLTETELIDVLRENSAKNSEFNMSDIVKDFTKVPVLILDDFGTVKETDFVHEKEFGILNKRYELGLTTIINSNCPPQEIASRNRRLGSRIQDERWMKALFVGGKDHRISDRKISVL